MKNNSASAQKYFLSGQVDRLIEINVLYSIQDLNTFFQRTLERLTAGDQPIPPARLLMTAVRTASAISLAPLDSPPELISPARPIKQFTTW